MTKLEENNLNAQVSLMKDIISLQESLITHGAYASDDIKDLLQKGLYDSSGEGRYILDAKSFEKALNILSLMSIKEFGALNSSTEKYSEEIRIKTEILSQLQK